MYRFGIKDPDLAYGDDNSQIFRIFISNLNGFWGFYHDPNVGGSIRPGLPRVPAHLAHYLYFPHPNGPVEILVPKVSSKTHSIIKWVPTISRGGPSLPPRPRDTH
jgi:hypothetical protein